MKSIIIAHLVLASSAFADVGISNDANAFLKSLPEKSVCDGTLVNDSSGNRTQLSKKVEIRVNSSDRSQPEIEVLAPDAGEALSHFKIGNGYGGRLEKLGHYSYFFDSEKSVIYYLRVRNEGDRVTYQQVLAARDAGALVYFSTQRICNRSYRCIELSNCWADIK